MADEGRSVRRTLQQLESLERAGVTHLPKPRRKPAAKVAAEAPPARPPLPIPHLPAPPAAAPIKLDSPPPASQLPGDERLRVLQIIRDEVAGCTRCSGLAATRTQTVFGAGNPYTRLLFIGEAPGADEDRTGIPFVGRAGQLLTDIIRACKLSREDVFIANILKCRPPENRKPEPDEVVNCIGYLERQIAVINPEVICCLGGVAAQNLLKTDIAIGKLRGKFHEYQGIPVLCTWHPSYLLRNPAAKRDTWEDMKMLMRRLGVEL